MKFKFILLLFIPLLVSAILLQKSRESAKKSLLLNIGLHEGVLRDNGILGKAAAKSVLEMEANSEQIVISEVEVLIFPNPSEEKKTSEKFVEDFKIILQRSGLELLASSSNSSYSWINQGESVFLLYFSSTKKESDIYIGKANHLPVYMQRPQKIVIVQPNNSTANESLEIEQNVEKEEVKPESKILNASENISNMLVGNWGTLAGAKVNWRDESTGNMLISGVSKGFGLELKADGTFLQSTVVTSGRPNYRVFVSTSGTWQVMKDQLWLYPVDRHYRKWENEIIMIDEHSVPESYSMFWRRQKNEITFKDCLYVRYTISDQEQELCKE